MIWDLIWINSAGNNGAAGVSQNAGILVVLVCNRCHFPNMAMWMLGNIIFVKHRILIPCCLKNFTAMARFNGIHHNNHIQAQSCQLFNSELSKFCLSVNYVSWYSMLHITNIHNTSKVSCHLNKCLEDCLKLLPVLIVIWRLVLKSYVCFIDCNHFCIPVKLPWIVLFYASVCQYTMPW